MSVNPGKNYWFLMLVAFVVLSDEWIKSLALKRFPLEERIVDQGILTLAIHRNWRLAFDIPYTPQFVIFFSAIIGAGLLHMAYKHARSRPQITFAALTIIIGTLGNLYDRLVYGFTVDYLIWFGRSALNLSDLVIILGVILLLISSKRKKLQFDKTGEGR